MPPPKIFLYARKSTDTEDRQVYSIEHQLAELRQIAVRKNLNIVAEFTENRTARIPGRPIFQDMIARIKKGEASGILAWHPDRLSRNPVDGGEIMHLIDQGIIAQLEFSVFWFEPTPQGNLMLSIAFGMSKYYTDALSQNIIRGQRQRILAGYWPRRPPLGYHFDRNIRNIVPDPQLAPLIRKIFELYATGDYTLERLAGVMSISGLTSPDPTCRGKPISLSYYLTMLTNPIYAGMIRSNGELFEGKHEPIVPLSLFDACQMLLAQKGRSSAPKRKPFLYRGMFVCGECGGTITMEIQKGHTYLRCTKRNGPCDQPYLREEEAVIQVAKILRNFVVPQEIIDSLADELEAKRMREKHAWIDEAKNIKTRIGSFDVKLQRLTDVYVDGTLLLTDYKEMKEKLLKQKLTWAEKLHAVESTRQSSIEPTVRFIRGLTEARIVAEGDDKTKQRDFLQKTCSNLNLAGGRVLWEARGAWKHVVPLARFARRPPHLSPPSDAADNVYSRLCATPLQNRTSLGVFHAFFEDNPAWA